MSRRRAIIGAKGFREKRQWAKTCGIDAIMDAVEEAFPDRRATYIARCTWDEDPAIVVEDILRLGITEIDAVCFSWGNGKFGVDLAKLLGRYGLGIRRWLAIDPVPYVFARWISQACIPTKSPFEMPGNVRAYATWRTVNWRNIRDPWGRHVVGDGRCLRRVVFGTPANLARPRYNAIGTAVVDDGRTVHTNIDEHKLVRSEILERLQEGVV